MATVFMGNVESFLRHTRAACEEHVPAILMATRGVGNDNRPRDGSAFLSSGHAVVYILTLMRRQLKSFLRRFGYHVYRVPANRFDATVDALVLLQTFGYAPRVWG